jgi:hypothetical protein
MVDGMKRVQLRSLAVLTNDSETPLEVSAVPRALQNADDSKRAGTGQDSKQDDDDFTGPLEVEQEIFENERYLPCVGWGSTWPGHFLPVSISVLTEAG